MAPRGHSPAMPCHYPEGEPTDWCERHASDHAMIRALREERLSALSGLARA